MKNLKKNLLSIGLTLSMVLALTLSFNAQEAQAIGGSTYEGGYCTDGTNTWTACNFPNGPCNNPIWCSANQPKLEREN